MRANKLGRAADCLLQLLKYSLLVVHGQRGIGHDIHKQDMCHLQTVSGTWIVCVHWLRFQNLTVSIEYFNLTEIDLGRILDRANVQVNAAAIGRAS